MGNKEITFDESVKQVMKSLPPAIRNYIHDEKYTAVAQSLMTKYGLRVDQGGVLEREILLLLMGVENPAEFTEALAEEARLTQAVITGIVQDVNDRIFVPLRREEEKGEAVEPQIKKAEHQKIVSLPAVPAPKKDLSGLPPAPMKGTLPPKEFLPRPVGAQSAVGPRSSSLGDVVRSVLAAPKPIEASKMLEDHEEAHIEMKKEEMPKPVAQEVQPSPILKVEPQIQMPKAEPQMQNAARPQVAPENLPGVMMEPVISAALVVPIAVPTPITSYSADPYREPIDEPPGN